MTPPPPLAPSLRFTDQYYSIVQELHTSNSSLQAVLDNSTFAARRCALLSSRAVATIEPIGFSLLDATPCAAHAQAVVLSCTYTGEQSRVSEFNAWLDTQPLPASASACVAAQVAHTGRVVLPVESPQPPQPPKPPQPPPRPLPSPPPPPPSSPPTPPTPPTPPAQPPQSPPQPPRPPEDPPVPPSPPHSEQIAATNLCHPTCVRFTATRTRAATCFYSRHSVSVGCVGAR